ncbi:PP2C family protein-serine/threonine phosphatase, partial [Kitasatospora sp. LaBMicrA B282]|uniref:PP2C family protein-serine/threonine phosphatase n=1 Tax=Kitasatospora sp. LaBMicrA B282 TaxID=3420949 RepID=UPI003D09913F
TIILGAFRVLAELVPRLDYLVESIEHALDRDIRRRGDTEDPEAFATAIIAQFAPDGSYVDLVNRGHPAPILLTDGTARLLDPPAFDLPLGMADLRATDGHHPQRIPLPTGATLLLFTDGITEARDATGAFYTPETFLAGRTFATPEDLLSALLTDIATHTDHSAADDDQTLLAITRAARAPDKRPDPRG